MLIAFASHSTRIAIAASPVPRKIAFTRNSKTIVALPPYMIRAYVVPIANTLGDAPMSPNKCGAAITPLTPRMSAINAPSTMACTAALAAPSASRSPVRRATMAVAPMARPIASE